MKRLILPFVVLAAGASARAGDPNPDGAKTAFDPRVHGFDFVNYYEGDMLIEVPLVGTVDVGEAPYGLCGGMGFSALDTFYAGIEMPNFGSTSDGGPPPSFASGQPLRSYVYGRQMDSLRAKDAFLVRRLISWVPRPIHSNWLVTGLNELTSRAFKEKIAPALDDGCPVPLSLVKADADDFLPDFSNPTLAPRGFTKNHQVVAIGYRRHTRGPDHWDIDIYDPNYPDEVHTLHLKLRVQTARVKANGQLFPNADDPDENRRERFRGLYRTPYDAKRAPWDETGSEPGSTVAKGRRDALGRFALDEQDAGDEPAAAAAPDIDGALSDLEERVARLEARAASAGPAVVCLDVASDLSPIHPTRTLPFGARELSVAIGPEHAARFRELGVAFVAVDVGDAAPPGTEIGRTTQPSAGRERVRFRYRQENALPEGSYRVDLFGDGRAWLSLPFRVAASPSSGFSFPLALGQTWTYDFVQETGAGARLVDGGVSHGNRLAAVVELRVAESGSDRPARIELRRDGALVSQEWWSFDQDGLFASRRVIDGETYELDPPQPLLSAAGVDAWEYGTPELGQPQTGRQWGPVPLSGPWGEAQGYVVRTEQAEDGLVHTAEREFVPGIGLVRERITTARGGKLVASQELVLRAGRS